MAEITNIQEVETVIEQQETRITTVLGDFCTRHGVHALMLPMIGMHEAGKSSLLALITKRFRQILPAEQFQVLDPVCPFRNNLFGRMVLAYIDRPNNPLSRDIIKIILSAYEQHGNDPDLTDELHTLTQIQDFNSYRLLGRDQYRVILLGFAAIIGQIKIAKQVEELYYDQNKVVICPMDRELLDGFNIDWIIWDQDDGLVSIMRNIFSMRYFHQIGFIPTYPDRLGLSKWHVEKTHTVLPQLLKVTPRIAMLRALSKTSSVHDPRPIDRMLLYHELENHLKKVFPTSNCFFPQIDTSYHLSTRETYSIWLGHMMSYFQDSLTQT